MKIAIMQPYFFPYIGYFQLLNAVDEFIVYDKIKFTKKGWINRNKILVNSQSEYITLPLKKDSDFLPINERYLAESWLTDRKKLLNKIKEAYHKAPYFDQVYELISSCLHFPDDNLFKIIFNSLVQIKKFLKIETPFVISSTIPLNDSLKAEAMVLQICKERKTNIYINPIGGLDLYDSNNFKKEGIDLFFLKTDEISYRQFDQEFIPSLSIIDIMMFNSVEEITKILQKFTLITGKSQVLIS